MNFKWGRKVWCEFFPAAVAMNKKSYPNSLCYGFIFNLLVALCTIGFMCYFLYRFDSRLVSLERRLWDKERVESVAPSRKPASFRQENHNKRRHFKKTNENGFEDSYVQHGVPSEFEREKTQSPQRKRVLKLSAWYPRRRRLLEHWLCIVYKMSRFDWIHSLWRHPWRNNLAGLCRSAIVLFVYTSYTAWNIFSL